MGQNETTRIWTTGFLLSMLTHSLFFRRANSQQIQQAQICRLGGGGRSQRVCSIEAERFAASPVVPDSQGVDGTPSPWPFSRGPKGIGIGRRARPYCGWTTCCTTLKPCIYRGIIIPGFLRWCEIDFVHPQYCDVRAIRFQTDV